MTSLLLCLFAMTATAGCFSVQTLTIVNEVSRRRNGELLIERCALHVYYGGRVEIGQCDVAPPLPADDEVDQHAGSSPTVADDAVLQGLARRPAEARSVTSSAPP